MAGENGGGDLHEEGARLRVGEHAAERREMREQLAALRPLEHQHPLLLTLVHCAHRRQQTLTLLYIQSNHKSIDRFGSERYGELIRKQVSATATATVTLTLTL